MVVKGTSCRQSEFFWNEVTGETQWEDPGGKWSGDLTLLLLLYHRSLIVMSEQVSLSTMKTGNLTGLHLKGSALQLTLR